PGCASVGSAAVYPAADRRVVWHCTSRLFVVDLVVPSRARPFASNDRQRLGPQHTRLPHPAGYRRSAACHPGGRDGAWCCCILFYFYPRVPDDDPTAASQGRLALRARWHRLNELYPRRMVPALRFERLERAVGGLGILVPQYR